MEVEFWLLDAQNLTVPLRCYRRQQRDLGVAGSKVAQGQSEITKAYVDRVAVERGADLRSLILQDYAQEAIQLLVFAPVSAMVRRCRGQPCLDQPRQAQAIKPPLLMPQSSVVPDLADRRDNRNRRWHEGRTQHIEHTKELRLRVAVLAEVFGSEAV